MKKSNQPKKVQIFSILQRKGYLFAPSYLQEMVFKTNAPFELLYQMREEWKKIMEDKDCEKQFDWSENKDIKKMLKNSAPRFLPNPEKNWGPKKGAVLNIHQPR